MGSKQTETTKLHVQRNTRNFILGTISLFSAEFYKLFIHLVEGNTRIAQRKEIANKMYALVTCELVLPENQNRDLGFDDENYSRVKELYIERFGSNSFSRCHMSYETIFSAVVSDCVMAMIDDGFITY